MVLLRFIKPIPTKDREYTTKEFNGLYQIVNPDPKYRLKPID